MRISLRFKVFKRDEFTCRYCGSKSPEAILEVDHVIPVSAGGLDEFENLVTSCYSCNRGKGARLLTNIPQEENIHEKAVLLAEREMQLAELQYWRWKQRTREDKELQALLDIWSSRFNAHYWKESRVRGFLRSIGYLDVGEALEYTVDHAKAWGDRPKGLSAWILFCSICTKRSSGNGADNAE